MSTGGELTGGAELVGEVVGTIYADPSTGFGVVELLCEQDGAGARCAGPLSDLVEGQRVRVVGGWSEHPTYGPTFDVTFYEQVAPATVAGLRTFLSSERFEDVADRVVTRVLSAFGSGAGRVIEREPDRLVDEAGVSRAAARRLHERWAEGQALADLVRFVEPAGLPMGVVRAVHARFGADAPRVAREEPYELLVVPRCRFAHADALAEQVGIDPLAEPRLRAGTHAAVRAARRRDGHEYLTRTQTLTAAARLLDVDTVAAQAGLQGAVDAGLLTVDELDGDDEDGDTVTAVYPAAALEIERALAADVVRLLGSSSRLRSHADQLDPAAELTDDQAEAVRAAFRSPLTVLTGGPGTGKTRTIEEVARAAEAAELSVALCAPTGRAAKRVEELAGRPATTVHRLLEARPREEGGFSFRYGPDERLPVDLVVCDEVSMCDTALAGRLLGAVDDGAHLLLVGDPDQLPPVGPGDVLRDLMASSAVPAVTLREIHRQAADSRIVALARAVDAGEVRPLPGNDAEQVFMAEEPRRSAIVPRVVEAVARRVPDYLSVPSGDVQVLAPVYRGPAGVDALNTALKKALSPDDGRPAVSGLQAGDRVMQTRNDAERDVSNGDVGTVVDVDRGGGELRVAFPRGEVTYDRDQAGDLTHAWAVTVHKSQGGEWPVVVVVVDRSHRGMLWRNLVYTAVTRARRAVIIVGQADALRAAAARDRPRDRQTALTARIAAAAD